MEVMAGEGDCGQLGLGDLDADRVVAGVELRSDLEALLVGRGADEVDDDLVAGKGPASPVRGDSAPEPVLDLG